MSETIKETIKEMQFKTNNIEPKASTSKLTVNNGPVTAPICIIVLGMAGSGKTTFVKKLTQLSYDTYKPYVINLDPACREVPYNANIDIRDTVNYKEVMKHYKLGPNGAIVTSLNLFTTKMDKVIELVRRAGENGHKWCIIDTPGQIEVFTWSASGTIITESLATMFPTVVLYVMDVERSLCPTTFMSNMLYACSILYKSSLPFLVALNKIDVQDCNFINEWMTDFETFHDALEQHQTFVSNLTRSMSLTLDTFYENLKTCGVSSMAGIGFPRIFEMITEAAEEYERDYKMEYEKLRLQKLANQNNEIKIDQKISTHGTEVSLIPGNIEDVSSGADISDIFLRFPGTEPEESDNDEEIEPVEHVEEQNFQNFIEQHKNAQNSKREKLNAAEMINKKS